MIDVFFAAVSQRSDVSSNNTKKQGRHQAKDHAQFLLPRVFFDLISHCTKQFA